MSEFHNEHSRNFGRAASLPQSGCREPGATSSFFLNLPPAPRADSLRHHGANPERLYFRDELNALAKIALELGDSGRLSPRPSPIYLGAHRESNLARLIAGLFLNQCRLYSSFSAFKSSIGIEAALALAFRSLTPGPSSFSSTKMSRANSRAALFATLLRLRIVRLVSTRRLELS